MRSAKKRAAELGVSLTRVFEDALRGLFAPPRRKAERFRFAPLVKHGAAAPGVDFSDRDSLYEWMERLE